MKVLVIFSLLIASTGFAQRLTNPNKLNNKGYYAATEEQLKSAKNLSFDESKLLVVAYYNQWKYRSATELINSLDKNLVLNDSILKPINFDLQRINSNYSEAGASARMDNKDLDDLVQWPSNNLGKQEVQLNLVPIFNNEERYTGAYVNKENEFYLAKKISKSKLEESFYRIQKAKVSPSNEVGAWTDAIEVKRNKTIFVSSPTLFLEGNYIISLSNVDYIQIAPRKMKKEGIETEENTLGLYNYNTESGEVTKLPPSINVENSNSTHPYFVNDKYLFFTSDMETHGDMDIYYSVYENGAWNAPKKLNVNSEYADVFPYVLEDNFYFSSRGHENFGGLDVFKASISFNGNDVTCGKPQNMMLPFNSSYDDILIHFKNRTDGYLATNRDTENGDQVFAFKLSLGDQLKSVLANKNGKSIDGSLEIFVKDKNGDWALDNKYDTSNGAFPEVTLDKYKDYKLLYSSNGMHDSTIYVNSMKDPNSNRTEMLEKLKEVRLQTKRFEGFIKDRITDKPLANTLITIKSKDKDGNIQTQTIVSDKDGKWSMDYDPEREYDFNLAKSGYEDFNKMVFNEDDMRDLSLVPMNQKNKKGDKISIPNIYFDFNSAELQERSYPILENIVNYLTERPEMKVELSAHTDAVGSDAYNMKLSIERAKTCYKNLIDGGVAPNQLIYKGYGETQLVNGCKNGTDCSEEENEVNRRVELKILDEGAVVKQSTETGTKTESGDSNYGVSSDGKYYIMKKGETLYRVYVATQVKVATIKELNGLKNNNTYDGMRLKLK